MGNQASDDGHRLEGASSEDAVVETVHQPAISSDGRSSSSRLTSGDPARVAVSPLQGFVSSPGALTGTRGGIDGDVSSVRRRKGNNRGAAREGGGELAADRADLLDDRPKVPSPLTFPAENGCDNRDGVGGGSSTSSSGSGSGDSGRRGRSPFFIDDVEGGAAEKASGGRTTASEGTLQGSTIGQAEGWMGDGTGRDGLSAVYGRFAGSSSAALTTAAVGHDRNGLARGRGDAPGTSNLAGSRGGGGGSSS
ncbi:unnamed protein product, partial [Scytosiphon promiscuus]